MDARRQNRIIVNFEAEIVLNDKRYSSFIENLSEDGVYVVTSQAKSSLEFIKDTLLELRFSFPSGEKIRLRCKVKWSYSTPPHGMTNSIGLEILDPPLLYKEILKSFK